MHDRRRSSRLTGLITTLSLLMLMTLLAGCRDTTTEAQIAADAATTVSANQANATIAAAQADADARKVEAQELGKSAVEVSANQADADKHQADQETEQARIWATVSPYLLGILALSALAGIVLVYRGKIGLRRVDREVALLSPPSVAPSPSPPSQRIPAREEAPQAVRFAILEHNADGAQPGNQPGEWHLLKGGRVLLVMRARQPQLIDSQG